jgi:hypothetical protein
MKTLAVLVFIVIGSQMLLLAASYLNFLKQERKERLEKWQD